MRPELQDACESLEMLGREYGFRPQLERTVGKKLPIRILLSRKDGYSIFLSTQSERIQFYWQGYGHDQIEKLAQDYIKDDPDDTARAILKKALQLEDRFTTEKTKQVADKILKHKTDHNLP